MVSRILLAHAGKRAKAKSARARGAPQVAQLQPAEPLDGVEFASDAARALAERHGLTWRSFAVSLKTPSGKSGYTKGDVKAVVEERDAAPG